jgi:hypothetical protein
MEILKKAALIFTLVVFVVCSLVVREDMENERPWATILLSLSMAALMTVQW